MRAAVLAADDRIYVYGVARTAFNCALPLAACDGVVPGRPVELVPFRGLAAIVSAFPAEAAPKSGLNEGEWARSRAVAHHRVLTELANRVPLAPSKFGTVVRSLDSLAALIERNSAMLEETLDRVAGCREWGLKLSGDPSIARAAAGSAPSLAPLREELASAPDGKAYFIRKKLKLAVEAQAQRMLTAHAIEVHQRLDALARRSVHIRGYRGLSTGGANGQCMLLNAAYLVEFRRRRQIPSRPGRHPRLIRRSGVERRANRALAALFLCQRLGGGGSAAGASRAASRSTGKIRSPALDCFAWRAMTALTSRRTRL